MTERNRWLGGVLSCLIAAQFAFGIYFAVWIAARPSKFFDSYPRSHVDSRPLPAQQIPAIDLDPFRTCISQSWKFGELLFVNISVAFGASLISDVVSLRVCLHASQSMFLTSCTAADVLAFLSILITAKKPWHSRYPGIPSLLDTILRDATVYFVFMALCQVSSDLFVSFAPVSHPRWWMIESCSSCANIQRSAQAFPGL